MKKTIWLFIASVSGLVAFGTVFSMYAFRFSPGTNAYLVFGLIMLILFISAIIYLRRLVDGLKGIPVDDEMSGKISRKAAADSFPHAVSLWVILLIISLISGGPVLSFCLGISGMALLYGGFWLFYRMKGLNQ